jgi:rod shape-determining protein MreD
MDSRREIEIRHYPMLVYVLAPLIALVLQAWLPGLVRPYVWFDFPLLVTIYFAMARRSPIQGTTIGFILGILEDALTHRPIGINGVAKTLVGYLAASVGVRIDVENVTIRVLLTFLLSVFSSATYLFVVRILLGLVIEWVWYNELFKAIGNSLIVLVLFHLLDRFKIRD